MTNNDVMKRFSLGMYARGNTMTSVPVKGDAGVSFLFSYQQLIAVKVFNKVYLADYTASGIGSLSQTTSTHVNMVKRMERCEVHILGTKKEVEDTFVFGTSFAEALRKAA